MSKPLAIYASISASDPSGPVWDQDLGVAPVQVEKPFDKWPVFHWNNNPIEDYRPLFYGEMAAPLWSHPKVINPVHGENHTFIRNWLVGGMEDNFSAQVIPALDLIFVLTCAADDNYSTGLFVGGVQNGDLLSPIGANGIEKNPWRNVGTFVYRVNLKNAQPGTVLALVSEITNNPQSKSTPENNPAMFTWMMQIFDYENL